MRDEAREKRRIAASEATPRAATAAGRGCPTYYRERKEEGRCTIASGAGPCATATNGGCPLATKRGRERWASEGEREREVGVGGRESEGERY